MENIQYFKATKYGKNHYYLLNETTQASWQRLTSKKTISKEDMKNLKALLDFNLTFTEVLPPRN